MRNSSALPIELCIEQRNKAVIEFARLVPDRGESSLSNPKSCNSMFYFALAKQNWKYTIFTDVVFVVVTYSLSILLDRASVDKDSTGLPHHNPLEVAQIPSDEQQSDGEASRKKEDEF
jgi:hypothetical protein